LQTRAKKQGITMAVQIREALESYALRLKHEKPKREEIEPLDLGDLFKVLDSIENDPTIPAGPTDLAENHDKYLYGEYSDLWQPNINEKPKTVKESKAVYKTKTKKRVVPKRKGSRK
jgi:hypothetical protein